MNEAGKARLNRVARWLLVAMTLVLAALLIMQCADIYFTGTAPSNLTETGVYIQPIYSREIVGEHLSEIYEVFLFWLAVLITALLTRQPAAKTAVKTPVANQLELLQKRTETTPEMAREQKKRKILLTICVVVCAVCAVMVWLYMSDLSHFESRDLEPVIGAMLIHVVPWVAAAFVCIMVFEQLNCKSMLAEIEEAKKAPKRQPEPAKVPDTKVRNVVRAALYVAAAVMLVAGISNGGMRDVLIKAINICTECIGLG